MINTPKGIVLIRSGPLEKLIPLLKQLKIVDEKGIPFSSNEISSKLTHNMKNLDENPMLKQQYENNPMEMIEKMRKDAEEKNKKKSRKKRFGLF